jgi:hypothetical protein
MSKIVYSSLYEEYLVIYNHPITKKTTIEHCGSRMIDAQTFRDSLVTSIPMWYDK